MLRYVPRTIETRAPCVALTRVHLGLCVTPVRRQISGWIANNQRRGSTVSIDKDNGRGSDDIAVSRDLASLLTPAVLPATVQFGLSNGRTIAVILRRMENFMDDGRDLDHSYFG